MDSVLPQCLPHCNSWGVWNFPFGLQCDLNGLTLRHELITPGPFAADRLSLLPPVAPWSQEMYPRCPGEVFWVVREIRCSWPAPCECCFLAVFVPIRPHVFPGSQGSAHQAIRLRAEIHIFLHILSLLPVVEIISVMFYVFSSFSCCIDI